MKWRNVLFWLGLVTVGYYEVLFFSIRRALLYLQVMGVLSEEQYISGKCFLSAAPLAETEKPPPVASLYFFVLLLPTWIWLAVWTWAFTLYAVRKEERFILINELVQAFCVALFTVIFWHILRSNLFNKFIYAQM